MLGISEHGNILYTAGFRNDTVEVVGEIMASNLDLDRVLSRWLYLVFGEEEPPHSYKYIGGGTMFEVFNRTFCVDHDFYGRQPNPGSCGMVFNVELVPKHHHADVEDEEERRDRLITEQRDVIAHMAPGRRFFYTKDG